MSNPRLRVALSILVLLGAELSTPSVMGQAYPAKPVRFIVASGPGGSDDFHGRLMAQSFTEILGQQFIVDNRPGAGGLIGQTAVFNAAPDGYTILLSGRSLTAAAFLN